MSAGSSGAAQPVASNISSRLSPTASPPSAWPSKPSAAISSIERRRSSGVGRALRDPEDELALGARSACRCRAAQSVVSRTACSSSRRGTPAGGQMSKAIAMSEPRFRWIRAAASGEKRAGAPS